MRIRLFTLLLILFGFPARASIQLDIIGWPDQLDQLRQPLRVRVVSSVLLDRVQATLHGNTITLAVDGANQASGVFDTSSMPSGQATVRITARDVQGNEASTEATSVIDRPPRIEVEFPQARLTTARPDVRIRARCSDDNSCQVRITIYRRGQAAGQELYSWQGADVDQVANVAHADGEILEVRYQASDERGQLSVASRFVAVELSPFLRPLIRVEGDIKDFDGTTLLFAGFDGAWWTQNLASSPQSAFSIGRLVEQCEHELPTRLVYQGDPRCRPTEGHLTSVGVLVAGSSSLGRPAPIQLWHNDGGTTSLGQGIAPLKVNGVHAAWCCSLADLSTGRTADFAQDATGYEFTSDGRFLFTHLGLWEHSLSGSNRVAEQPNSRAFAPVGDQVRTAYVESAADRDRFATLHIIDDGGERDAGLISGIKHGVLANDGWLAFVRNVGPQEIPNIVLMSPDGGEQQVTQWGVPNSVEALNANGEMSYFHGSLNEEDYRTKRAMVWWDRQTFDVGGQAGKLIWRSGAWFLVLGDTLFALERDGGVIDSLPVDRPDAGGTDGGLPGNATTQSPKCGCSAAPPVWAALIVVVSHWRRRSIARSKTPCA